MVGSDGNGGNKGVGGNGAKGDGGLGGGGRGEGGGDRDDGGGGNTASAEPAKTASSTRMIASRQLRRYIIRYDVRYLQMRSVKHVDRISCFKRKGSACRSSVARADATLPAHLGPVSEGRGAKQALTRSLSEFVHRPAAPKPSLRARN